MSPLRPTIPLLLSLCLLMLLAQGPAGNTLPEQEQGVPHETHDFDESEVEPLEHAGHDHAILPAASDDAAAELSPEQHDAFAAAVDLSPLRDLPAFDGGRVKILETLTAEHIARMYGRDAWRDPDTQTKHDPLFTYLDLIFGGEYYVDRPVIHIEQLELRQALVEHLNAAEQERWLHIGRLTPRMLSSVRTQEVLRRYAADQRTAAGVNQAWGAFNALNNTGAGLNMISPVPGRSQWIHLSALQATDAADVPAYQNPLAARDAAEALDRLRSAWRASNAPGVNAAARELAQALPRINPSTWPASWRLDAERVYNATHRFTLGWIAYAVAALLLLLAFATGRRSLAWSGVAMLALGLLVHTAGLAVRGLLAGRWPIHNQYEAFFAISWFVVVMGTLFMLFRRQWLFGAAAAALGFGCLLFANTTDIPSSNVGVVAAILSTSWILYIHVNIVLISYALISLGFIMSLAYLGAYFLRGRRVMRMAAAGVGEVEWEEADATSSGGGGGAREPTRARVLEELDRAQLIVLQLAFWLLAVGIALGAYWADHAWGRFWAWDPKETWALITWIIYLVAIHARLGVANKGLVTALLSVAGFIAMLWCYWGVNLYLAGLHSYA